MTSHLGNALDHVQSQGFSGALLNTSLNELSDSTLLHRFRFECTELHSEASFCQGPNHLRSVNFTVISCIENENDPKLVYVLLDKKGVMYAKVIDE